MQYSYICYLSWSGEIHFLPCCDSSYTEDKGPNGPSTSIPITYWDLENDIQVGLYPLWTHYKLDLGRTTFFPGP